MPVKSKYPPLTDEEKKKIIARHKELVDKMNAVLPEEMRVSYDKNLLKKLNDPEAVALHRIGNEMKEVEEKQQRIREQLENRFGKYTSSKTNPFARNFNYSLRIDDTEDARKYNEKLYQDFLHNPDRLAYVRYKDVLKLNPQEILDCKGSPAKLAEYYKKNYCALKDAFEYGHAFTSVDATQGMKEGYDGISGQLNFVGRIEKEVVYLGSSIDYFAYPKLTNDQANYLLDNIGDFRELDPENDTIIPYIQTSLERGKIDVFTVFETIQKSGAELSEGSIVKYKPVAKNKFNNSEKEVSLGKFFPDENEVVDPNVNYVFSPRTDDEVKRIKLMTCDASYLYANEWRKRFETRSNLRTFDPDRIESSLKLGRLSSWFGRGNSREYNRLMETYRQFNDPRHKNFLNEDLLREAAVNYRDRKANQGHTGQGNSLDDRRMKFADDIIATCDQCKAEQSQIFRNIDNEFFTDYPPKKVPFLSSEDVEEKEYEYNVSEKELNKEIDFSKNIDEIAIK